MAADRKEETDQPAGMPITGLILIDPALLPHIYFDIFVPLPLRTRIMDRTEMDDIRQALAMAGFQFNASISINGGK